MRNHLFLLLLLCTTLNIYAQEFTAPLLGNPALQSTAVKTFGYQFREEPITLPFFEDFNYYQDSPFPTDWWWIDSQVYVNNHFIPYSMNKGVGTFDVLNQYGQAYHSTDPWSKRFCDSLTSYYIDMSAHSAADSVYLSFAYLSKGLGYFPKGNDSLLIYMTDSINGWTFVDFVRLDTASEWKHKMIPITNERFFFNNFQFRIINRGTIGTSGSHWHLDNIYLNTNRNIHDTQLTNVAFTIPPQNMLNDFTAMPFKHFNTDRAGFLNEMFTVNLFYTNYSGMVHNSEFFYSAKNALTGTPYGDHSTSFSLGPLIQTPFEIPVYNPTALSPAADGYLKIEHQFYFPSVVLDTFKRDDTIIHYQEFDNYFAYDDGSAEQAYYLNLAPANAGKIAVEYACYVPDTLAGVAIQFARQVPTNEYKEFFIQIYKSLELGGDGGELIYEEEGFYPEFGTAGQEFVVYPLKELVPLDVGQFFVVIMMPASGISDSLMIGLDMNRTGANHRYYNVLSQWESSLLDGALMVRPIMGNQLITGIQNLEELNKTVQIYPNPSNDRIFAQHPKSLDFKAYRILDIQGRVIQSGSWNRSGIQIVDLPIGNYILELTDLQEQLYSSKFIKK